jgi:hypothetical protein
MVDRFRRIHADFAHESLIGNDETMSVVRWLTVRSLSPRRLYLIRKFNQVAASLYAGS